MQPEIESMSERQKKRARRWFRLDNAALIFPAIMRKNWNNCFRLSVTLREPVDPDCLSRAVRDLMPRFPTFFVRLRTGMFWHYLEQIREPIRIQPEFAYPLTHMSRSELRRSCLRVLYFGNRMAVEIFHSVTDGAGGLIFTKNLAARYLELKYGLGIPAEQDIFDLRQTPSPEELRDCFLECSGAFATGGADEKVLRLRGTPEPDHFRHLTTGVVDTKALLDVSHTYGVSVSAFLAAVMAEAVARKQAAERPERRWKPVKITVPVNLRRLYGKETLRNFALTVNIGFDPRLGEYSLEEICAQMAHQLAAEAVPQKMSGKIAANVDPQRNALLRIMPLPVKTFVMRLVYRARGESGGCLNVSNLGPAAVPAVMEPYIERFEFIIGVQYSYPNNCSVLSYGGRTFINMIRSTRESELERLFFSRLVELGVGVDIESNQRRE